ncbi:MAG: glutaryl 7-ACA acylase, partial [Proteobacteria bacterium]|nr:glutaryl 7-ACA acylase [Pseudomonadota bacterium]
HTIPATPPPVTEKSTYQQLRAATNKNEVLTRADGTREIILSDDLGEAQNPHHAMEIGATVQQKFSIHPDNPLSAIAETKWEYTYRRDHWNTRIVSQNKMTCDAYSFILFREVIAYEGEDEILKKTWHEIIARDCC